MADNPLPLTPVSLLRAGPGLGKTALLVGRARRALQTGVSPARVLFLALDTAAAEMLERRFLAAVSDGPLALPPVLTYEQVARRILAEAHGDPTGRFLDPLTERVLVGRALQDTTGTARHFQAAPLRESPRFRDDVADFIAELKRHKLSPDDFRTRLLPGLPDRPALEDLADVYQRYQQMLQDAAVFDLRGLLWLALIALEDPALSASWRGRYRLLLADDLQDATPLHLELLAALAGPETQVAGSYEPAQTLYRFRGAVGDPGPWLRRLLPGRPVLPAPRLEPPAALPAALAQAAQRFAARFSLETPPLGGGGDPGRLDYALYRSHDDELDGLGDALVEALDSGERVPEDIAVLVRSQGEARAAAEYLALRGLPVTGSADAPGPWQARRLLLDLLTVLREASSPPRPPGAAFAARQQAAQALCRLADLIAAPAEALRLPALCRQADDLLRPDPPPNFPAFTALREQILAARAEPITTALLRVALWLLAQASPDCRSRLLGPLAALLGQVARVAEQLQRLTGRPLAADDLATTLAEASASPPFASPAISVLTAHQARGHHFPLVFLLGLQEETFPAPAVVSRLLSPHAAQALRDKLRRLLNLPEGVLSFAGLGEAPAEAAQEEQRLFFTCLTRSTRRLVLSAHLEAAGAPLTPSPFLAATLPEDFILRRDAARDGDFSCAFAGLTPEGPSGRADHTGCPVCPCPLGLARARRAPLPAEGSPDRPSSLVPILREAAARYVLYPTGLEDYLRCPRRFLLKELLKVAPQEDADNAVYGSAVHAFLRTLNHRAPAGRTPAEASRLLTEALAEARDRFSSPLAADLYAAMAVAALAVYLQTDLAAQRTLLPERIMRFEVADPLGTRHRFGGKIDVAAEVEGGVAVVDYKTGDIAGVTKLRSNLPLTADEAHAGATQVQLPMYALAWEAQPGTAPVRSLCLQNFSAKHSCKSSCLALGEGDKPTNTLTRADLESFRALLVQWAVEIKSRTQFEGSAPEEGCRPYLGGCPFVGICDEAELF